MTSGRAGALTLLRSRPGRLELRRRYTTWLWPIAARVAGMYRQTLGRRIRVVVVTGSLGKTTTMRTVSAALGLPVSRAALLNSNSTAAVGRALVQTPPWRKHAVFELGISNFGHMTAHARLSRPNVAVVTAVASDHWRSFKTLEATRNEKAEIVRSLSSNGVAVLNADDENVRWMATQTNARVVLAGESEDAEVRATDVRLDWPHGMRFTVTAGSESRPMTTRLVGRHMVFAALAAIAVATVEGRSLDDAIAAVEKVEATPGRMQALPLPNGAYALRDDFKSSDDSFVVALDTLAEIPANRRIVVFGEISEVTGRQAYRDVAAKAAKFVDRAIFVGSKTNFQPFRSGAAAAGMGPDKLSHVRHAWDATEMLSDELKPGDVVLIKGRWQQNLGRVGLALAGRDVQCHADPCPFKRMLCDVCPFLDQPFTGFGVDEVAKA